MKSKTSTSFQALSSNRRSLGSASITGPAFMPHMRRVEFCHSVM